MSDHATRALEREGRSVIRQRIRSGELPERDVRVAAWLGYAPALEAVDPWDGYPCNDFTSWSDGLPGLDCEDCARFNCVVWVGLIPRGRLLEFVVANARRQLAQLRRGAPSGSGQFEAILQLALTPGFEALEALEAGNWVGIPDFLHGVGRVSASLRFDLGTGYDVTLSHAVTRAVSSSPILCGKGGCAAVKLLLARILCGEEAE